MMKDEFYAFLRTIPKAEIHLHAEGAIGRDAVHALLARRPDHKTQPVDVDKLFSYNSLKEFISSFLFIQGLLEKPDDLAIVFEDVSKYLKENHIVYSELFFSPSMFLKKGFSFPEMMDVIQASVDKIAKRDRIQLKILIDVSRTFGVENAQANLETLQRYKKPVIVGIGLGGDEQKGPARLFGEVFQEAARQGLHVVAHAGEDDGPQSIWDALQIMGVERIGHGISAREDAELVRYLAEKRIPVEICLTSNIFTQKYVARAEDHPVRAFFDQGVLVTINTDDPTFFNASLIDEFWTLHTKLKFTMPEIKELILNGFRASFLPAEEKARYESLVETAWSKASAK